MDFQAVYIDVAKASLGRVRVVLVWGGRYIQGRLYLTIPLYVRDKMGLLPNGT